MQIKTYSRKQLFSLVSLRVIIGWYFLYEGLAKVFTPNWSAYGYLMDSKGIFSSFFKMLALNSTLLSIVDAINIYGLILIGILLILGCFTKYGYIGAILLLSMYYLSHPPLMNVNYVLPVEGSYLWIDKNIIILFSIIVLLLFPTSHLIGIDRVIYKNRKN